MATLSGKSRQSLFVRRKRATMSASEQHTRKYSCTNRSAWPATRGIVGIKHARDRFGEHAIDDRADEVAGAEFAKVEEIG